MRRPGTRARPRAREARGPERPGVNTCDRSNRFLNRVQVVPLTTKIHKLYPSEAYVTVQGKQVKALADQLTTVSKDRLENRIGDVSGADLTGIDRAIRVQLDLGR